MNFGMFTDFHVRRGMSQPEAFEESFRQVVEAEQMGIDTVWLAEHHFSPERSVLASPLIIASAIAARTSTIRVGLAVQVFPLTNPLRIAEEAATVDQVSKGRLEFGIGRSGLTSYYKGYNVPYDESRGRFYEALDVIMKGWGQEQFSYKGDYYSFNEVTVVPKPFQQPHPPTRVAAASDDTFPVLGSMGYPLFISLRGPIEDLRARVEIYREARAEAGFPRAGDCVLRIPTYIAETSEKARSEPEASTRHFLEYSSQQLSRNAGSEEGAERLRQNANIPYEDVLKNRVMFGTPGEVTERLQLYQEVLGISGVVMEHNWGGQIPYDRVINSLRLLTEKVAPNFK